MTYEFIELEFKGKDRNNSLKLFAKVRPDYNKLSAEGKNALENSDFFKNMLEILKKPTDVVHLRKYITAERSVTFSIELSTEAVK